MPRSQAKDGGALALFSCPNSDCGLFNQFNAGNLSIAERMGKNKSIRRLYCSRCGHRFSEREGSLMQYTKLPLATVIRVIKCLGHGCSVEATADICEVDARTVARMLGRAGKRAEDFHRLQLEARLPTAIDPPAVQLDELHSRVCKEPAKRGLRTASRMGHGFLDDIAAWAGIGHTWPWRSRRDS
jgi:transposase-like protein